MTTTNTAPHFLLRALFPAWTWTNAGTTGVYVLAIGTKARVREAGTARMVAELKAQGWDARYARSGRYGDGPWMVSVRCAITTQPTYVADGLYARDEGGRVAIPAAAIEAAELLG